MYRVGLESILGLQLRGSNLTVDPCICRDWSHYKILYRHGDTTYHITVENPEGVQRGVRSVEMDSVALPSAEIPLVDDGRTHQVRVLLGS
jgi:cyclic beta-1,2-glucan synthetase